MNINNEANLSVDFLSAIAIFLMVFMFAVTSVSGMLTPYVKDNYYIPTDNSMNLLLGHDGDERDGIVGLLVERGSPIINGDKVEKCFDNHGDWWELKDYTVFTKLFGFPSGNYYMQIIPVGNEISDASNSARDNVPLGETSGDVISIVRIATMESVLKNVFEGNDLLGREKPTKPVFNFTKNDIEKFDGKMSISMNNFIPLDSPPKMHIKSFKIGTEINPDFEIVSGKSIHPDVYINGDKIEYDVSGFDINNKTDQVKIVFNTDELDDRLSSWKDGFYFEFNFDGIEIKDGIINNNIHRDYGVYKIVVWRW